MKAATPIRRRHSNDGVLSAASHILPIRPELLKKLLADFHEPMLRRGSRVFHGPRAPAGSPASAITDEQVLALRRMHDWHGMTFSQIAEQTGVSLGNVANLCGYKNRVHLDPGPRPEPIRA